MEEYKAAAEESIDDYENPEEDEEEEEEQLLQEDFEPDDEEAYDKPNSNASGKRKNSFVWSYFRSVPGTNTYECVVCNSCVGNQTSNLARHLAASHNIQREVNGRIENCGRGRPSRSFIWKYCTKEDAKHARCHLCNKTLYCGGGNTTNVSKHLRRMHEHLFSSKVKADMDDLSETTQATASIDQSGAAAAHAIDEDDAIVKGRTPKQEQYDEREDQTPRRERKGGSYVWNYCDKLSRHTIRCKLCQKVMSFHGTANVITHLQRRHNIVGKVENDCSAMQNSTLDLNMSEDLNATDDKADLYNASKRYRRSAASASVVWQYCKRVGKDAVRCGFCKKNLSYQGTSNLQRHLHRMHGVVTQVRGYNAHGSENDEEFSSRQQPVVVSENFIWEHCTMTDDEDQAKCNMCNDVFDSKDTQTLIKHLTVTHAIEPRPSPSKPTRNLVATRKRHFDYSDNSSDDNDAFNNDDSWSRNEDKTLAFDEMNIKKDDSLYDDIIEEDHDQTNYDEDPFDPNTIQEVHLPNPLSPQSSREGSPIVNAMVSPAKDYANSKKMQKLNEERVRMETEYFREKAGFYRMQKYLTALQAKKVRVEMESFNQHPVEVAVNGDAYAVAISEQQATN